MEPSSTSQPFSWMSRSEYLSTLPLWRRCLAMLNWRPVFEIEQETAWLRHVNARFDALSQPSDLSSQTPPQADSN